MIPPQTRPNRKGPSRKRHYSNKYRAVEKIRGHRRDGILCPWQDRRGNWR